LRRSRLDPVATEVAACRSPLGTPGKRQRCRSRRGNARSRIGHADDFELSVPEPTCPGIADFTFTLKGSIVIHALSPTESLETYPNFTVSWSGNGKTLSSRGPASTRITYSDAAHTSIVRTEVRGLLTAVTLPGRGAIWLETGYLVFSGPFFGAPIIVRHGPLTARRRARLRTVFGAA
jgi:hypothetical protein